MEELSYQDKYWNFMTEVKGHSIYLSHYLQHSEKIDTRINMWLAITSNSSIATWAIWGKHELLWAGIIGASQMINAVKTYLPYRMRVKELRRACKKMDSFCLEVEKKWYDVSKGELTEKEIHLTLQKIKSKKLDIWYTTIKKSQVPHKEKIQKEAKGITREYFQLHYLL